MKKYKVIKAFFKQSEKKNYSIGDTIELSNEDAQNMLEYIDAETFGIVHKKTIEEADKEIKKANKKLKNND